MKARWNPVLGVKSWHVQHAEALAAVIDMIYNRLYAEYLTDAVTFCVSWTKPDVLIWD